MKKTGFTLIETIVALLIISIAGVALFRTQGELFVSTSNAHEYFRRIFAMKNYFVKAQQNGWFAEKQAKVENLTDPEVKLTYTVSSSNNQTLKKLKNLIKTKVSAQWFRQGLTGQGKEIKRDLVYFKYNLPKLENNPKN